MCLKHQHAGQAAHPVDVSEALEAGWIWSAIAVRYNPRLSATRQLARFPCSAYGISHAHGALYASWLGYGGRGFAATLTPSRFSFW